MSIDGAVSKSRHVQIGLRTRERMPKNALTLRNEAPFSRLLSYARVLYRFTERALVLLEKKPTCVFKVAELFSTLRCCVTEGSAHPSSPSSKRCPSNANVVEHAGTSLVLSARRVFSPLTRGGASFIGTTTRKAGSRGEALLPEQRTVSDSVKRCRDAFGGPLSRRERNARERPCDRL